MDIEQYGTKVIRLEKIAARLGVERSVARKWRDKEGFFRSGSPDSRQPGTRKLSFWIRTTITKLFSFARNRDSKLNDRFYNHSVDCGLAQILLNQESKKNEKDKGDE